VRQQWVSVVLDGSARFTALKLLLVLLFQLNSGLPANANNSQVKISIESPTGDRTRELGPGDAQFVLFAKHAGISSDGIVRSCVVRL
jgi:hypothetical protein